MVSNYCFKIILEIFTFSENNNLTIINYNNFFGNTASNNIIYLKSNNNLIIENSNSFFNNDY